MTIPSDPDPNPSEETARRTKPTTQEIQHHPVSARVPEEIGKGVFCTGVMVMQTREEFVIDFLSTMMQPAQIAALTDRRDDTSLLAGQSDGRGGGRRPPSYGFARRAGGMPYRDARAAPCARR